MYIIYIMAVRVSIPKNKILLFPLVGFLMRQFGGNSV
jgi:hypothetical protein